MSVAFVLSPFVSVIAFVPSQQDLPPESRVSPAFGRRRENQELSNNRKGKGSLRMPSAFCYSARAKTEGAGLSCWRLFGGEHPERFSLGAHIRSVHQRMRSRTVRIAS